MSNLEDTFLFHIRAAGLPEPEREYKFHPTRKWPFDFAYPYLRVAIEVEGGKWIQGRHQRPDGFEKDCEKYNAAALLGWYVYRFTADMIASGEALRTIEKALGVA